MSRACALLPLGGLAWLCLPAETSAAAAAQPSAERIVTRFVQEVCLTDVDRFERVRAVFRRPWKLAWHHEQKGIDFVVDAPAPKHDRFEEAWETKAAGGRVRIVTSKTDYEDPKRRDDSSAMLLIVPESLVDLPKLLAAGAGIALVPNGPVVDEPGLLEIHDPDGRVTRTAPYAGHLRHFLGSAREADPSVEIAAMRRWGEGSEEPLWRLNCGTRIGWQPVAPAGAARDRR